MPSDQRAHALLWLVHRFLETPDKIGTDFVNDMKLSEDKRVSLEQKDCSTENKDPPEELQFATQMKRIREACLLKYAAEEDQCSTSNPALSGEFRKQMLPVQ